MNSFSISIKSITGILFLFAVLMAIGHLIVLILQYGIEWKHQHAVAMLLNLGTEMSIPAFFSTILLFLSALILFLISRVRDCKHWKALACIFLALSLDEMVSLHERLILPMRELFGVSPFYFYAWIIPGTLGVLIFGIAFYGFWKRLPPVTRRGMLVAGLIFIGGAIGMEIIEGVYHYYNRSWTGPTMGFLILIEECLEMIGIILFIKTLLIYCKNNISLGGLRIVT